MTDNATKPKKRDERLAYEEDLVRRFCEGSILPEQLTQEQTVTLGVLLSDDRLLEQEKIVDYICSKDPLSAVGVLVAVAEQKIKRNQESAFRWVQALKKVACVHYGEDRGSQLASFYRLGMKMARNQTSPSLGKTLDLVYPFPKAERFKEGLLAGAIGNKNGDNISLLLKRDIIRWEDISSFLDKYVLNYQYLTPVSGHKSPQISFSKDMLEKMFASLHVEHKDEMIILFGKISCRSNDQRTQVLARKFFARHFATPHALWLLDGIPYTDPHSSSRKVQLASVYHLFKVMGTKYDEPLLTKMRQWCDTTFSDIHGVPVNGSKMQTGRTWISAIQEEMEQFLMGYEKRVLLKSVAKKDRGMVARKM